MVSFQPFRGYVYNQEEIRTHGGLLTAPPYDVLTPSQRESYYQGHIHNFLHVDLGRVLPNDPSPMAWHDRSAKVLQDWLREKVLVRAPEPRFYIMETSWTHPITGERLIRHGIIGLLRLEVPGPSARVRLHEQTFSFHKMERLDLMLKTQAQLSPIFGFFPDQGDRLLKRLLGLASERDPEIIIVDGTGEGHRVYFLDNPGECQAISAALTETTVYIADGHHRYMTALNYRDEILERRRKAKLPPPPPSSALDHVMTYLCPMGDPGLCVLPTHRILKRLGMDNEELLGRLAPYADVRRLPYKDCGKADAVARLTAKLAEDSKKGLTVFGLFLADADFCCFVKVREKVKETIASEEPTKASLSSLDVSILTNVILVRALGLTEELMDDPDCISYVSQVGEALNLVDGGDRAAFILNPTSLADILKVTEAGFVMPRKATYFYPKVMNGLVTNIVDPMETVPGSQALESPAKTAC
ncbi:MAG: DUF1015 domain-containing protein [Deltaproteobacteria bacterium]|jgi:uncharacterized protein (DUF1015 family)|nr:DUF1015 domain-containing protein [Deltaproteobacteria bacterium]